MNCITTALLARSKFNYYHIALSWPSSLKLARAQQPSHNTAMKACVQMTVLALFHICLYSLQKHIGGVAVASWHFLRGLHFITEYVSYTHTHMQIYISCVVAYVRVQSLRWLSQVFLQTIWETLWAQMIFKGKHTHLYSVILQMTTQGKEIHVKEGRREMLVTNSQ